MNFFRPTRLPIDPAGTPDRGFATMRVTSPYGLRDTEHFDGFHAGLDIGNARLGDEVIAIGSGSVILASNLPAPPWNYPAPTDKVAAWGPSYGGNVIVIEHAPGVWSQYAHLRSMQVARGQRVSAGQLLGHVGDSGSAAPPPAGGGGHLHFGIRLQSAVTNGHNGWVDPWPRIQPTGELGTLPDTAVQEEDMPKVIRTIVGQEVVIDGRADRPIRVYRDRPAFGASSFDVAAPTVVQPAFVVEGEPYRTASGVATSWYEYGATDAAQRRYFPTPHGTLRPIDTGSLRVQRARTAVEGALQANQAVRRAARDEQSALVAARDSLSQ